MVSLQRIGIRATSFVCTVSGIYVFFPHLVHHRFISDGYTTKVGTFRRGGDAGFRAYNVILKLCEVHIQLATIPEEEKRIFLGS